MNTLRLWLTCLLMEPRRLVGVALGGMALFVLLAVLVSGCKTLTLETREGRADCFIHVGPPLNMRCWEEGKEPHYIWTGTMKLNLSGVCKPCRDGTCPKCPDGTETNP